MSAEAMVIIFKGVGMLLALGGGILAVRYGFHLFRDGAGHGHEQTAVDLGTIKINARSAGSVVMASACVWALVGLWLSPNIERKGNDLRIYSLFTPAGKLEAFPIVAEPSSTHTSSYDADAIKALLREALSSSDKEAPMDPVATLDGIPAFMDVSSIKVVPYNSGKDVYLLAQLHAGEKSAALKYRVVKGRDSTLFIPAESGATDNPNYRSNDESK